MLMLVLAAMGQSIPSMYTAVDLCFNIALVSLRADGLLVLPSGVDV